MKCGRSSAQKQMGQMQRFHLTIYQFQLHNQIITHPIYLNIQSNTTTKNWETQTFINKLTSQWSLLVDSPVVELKVFAKINQNFQVVYSAKLSQGNETGLPTIIRGKSSQIIKLRYSLISKKKLKSELNSESKHELIGLRSSPRTGKQKEESFAEQSQRIIFERDSEYEEVSNITFKKGREGQTKQGAFENIDDEQQAFEGYLDDSTSFIEDLISIIPSHQNTVLHSHNELEKVTQKNESEEEYTTAEKWYIKKFNKSKRGLAKQLQSHKNGMNLKSKEQTEEVVYTNTDYEKDQMFRQLSDLSFSQQTLFKSVNFLVQSDDGPAAKICSLTRNDKQTSSNWNSHVNLPVKGTILIECINLNLTACGCLGSDEIESGLCLLYNQQGNEASKMNFKCKSVSNFNVQTHSMLKYNEISVTKVLSEEGAKSSFVGAPNGGKPQRISKEDESNIHGEQEMTQFSNQLFKASNFLQNNSKDIEYHDLGSVLEQEISTFRKHQKSKRRYEKQGSVYSDAETRKDCMGHKQQETNVCSVVPRVEKGKGDGKEEREARKRINKIKMKQYTEFMEQGHQQQPINNQVLAADTQQSEQVYQSISVSSPLQFPKTTQVVKKQSLKISKLGLESMPDDKYNNFGIDFAGLAPFEGEKANRIGEVNEFEKQRSSTIQAMELSPRNLMYSNIYNFHEQLQNEKRIKRKNISFKVCSISVSLHCSNYNSKAIKIYIDNHIYFTESSNHSHFLTWNSNGYFFLDVPKNSVLYIELFQDKKGLNSIIGRCRVHLHCLNLTEAKQMLIYDDFIRTEDQESIGRVLFNYELIERRGKSLNLKHFQKHKMDFQKSQNQSKRKSRVSTSMNKKNSDGIEKSSASFKRSRIDSKSMSGNSLYFQEEIIERLKNQQPIAKRKYTGGNILIAKANRFKHPGIIKYSNEPGPGSYDIGSSFDRHSQYYQK